MLLLTDSTSVVARLRLYTEFEWHWLRVDRGKVGGREHINVDVRPEKRIYIEHRAARGDTANGLIVTSLLADLMFISEAACATHCSPPPRLLMFI